MYDCNSLGCPEWHCTHSFVSCCLTLMSEIDEFLTAQPLHWVYDLQKLRGFLDENPNPEFRPKPENPFYRRETGKQSCYGDQAFVLLESLSECGGRRFASPKQMSFQKKAYLITLGKNSRNSWHLQMDQGLVNKLHIGFEKYPLFCYIHTSCMY